MDREPSLSLRPFFPSHYERQAKRPMGQAESTQSARPSPPPRSMTDSPSPTPTPTPTSPAPVKSRFGWPGRRKKSEDFSKSLANLSSSAPMPVVDASNHPAAGMSQASSRSRDLARIDTISSQADSSDLHMHDLSRPPSRSSAKQFVSTTLQALKGRLNASQSSVHSLRSPGTPPPVTPPPPVPPKPSTEIPRLSSSFSRGHPSTDAEAAAAEPPTVPAQSVKATKEATTDMTPLTAAEDAVSEPQRRERKEEAKATMEVAEDWRKSDSTLRTVRLVGSRTPRPLSLAESTTSSHTVLPSAGSPAANMGANKRLSALMTDVDFGLPEVDSEDESDADESIPLSAFSSVSDVRRAPAYQVATADSSRSSSPASPTGREANRRGSLSIRIGRFSGSRARAGVSGHQSGSESETHSSVSTHDLRTANSSTTSVTTGSSPSTKESAVSEHRPSVEIASTSSVGSDMSDIHRRYQEVRKLEPWASAPQASESQTSLSTSTSASSNSHTRDQLPPSSFHGPTPSMRPAHQRNRLQSIQSKGFRQTAVSLATGLAPAAGFAKKAADRLGRALGGSTTNLDVPPAGAPHSPSASPPSFLAIMNQNQPQTGHEQRKNGAQGHGHPQSPRSKRGMKRHGTSGTSGSWSIGSGSNSQSDTDGPTGASLGRRVRGPLRPGARGFVFGRDLAECVRDTAVEGGLSALNGNLNLEGRRLPALVVRCAQHIVKWGVQEEGLFRISGRATHVARLRGEFDSGADFDMRECGPGELDPHAVSSIFKAYLRELPEPLLTRKLMPYFEAALIAENSMVDAAYAQSKAGDHQDGQHARPAGGLPSNPKAGMALRKAPSLSTFAVPTLAPRAASESLLSAFKALIARLPRENRDLLRTLTELIAATARCAKETKMPLSNLLLVFCPSLAMSPPLLRVLCEGEGIWDGPVRGERSALIDDDVVLDIRAPSPVKKSAEENVDEDAPLADDEHEGLHAQRTIRRAPRTPTDEEEKAADSAEERSAAPGKGLTANSPISPYASSAGGGSKHSSYRTNPNSPPSLTHSSESLDTPLSATLESPAYTHSAGKLAVRKQSDLLARASEDVRRPHVGNPVPFPADEGSDASSVNKPMRRINSLRVSTYSVSSPNLRGDPSPLTTESLGSRKSKASLHSLLPKRSLSSLLGLSQQQAQVPPQQHQAANNGPDMTLEELGSLPPRSRTPLPVLTLPALASPLLPGFQIETDAGSLSCPAAGAPVSRSASRRGRPGPMGPRSPRPKATEVIKRNSSDSSVISDSVFYTPPTTARQIAPSGSLSSTASSSSYSFLDFNIKPGEEEDWASSVLQAAAGEV